MSEFKFKVKVIADSSGKYCGNGLTFDSVAEAEEYAKDLARRWTAVRKWQVFAIFHGQSGDYDVPVSEEHDA